MKNTIAAGDYVHLFERMWHDGDDLMLSVGGWNIVGVEDNDDRTVDDGTFMLTEIDKLISELLTAKRRLREHLDQQAA